MSSQMAEAIRQLIQDKGYSEEAVLQTIENTLKAAYKRTFGTNANAVVKFSDDRSDVLIYSRKTIVDGVYDPVTEIELEEALQGNDLELIRNKKDALLTAAQGVATKAYQKAQGAGNPTDAGSQNDDGTINADFEDISDDKK